MLAGAPLISPLPRSRCYKRIECWVTIPTDPYWSDRCCRFYFNFLRLHFYPRLFALPSSFFFCLYTFRIAPPRGGEFKCRRARGTDNCQATGKRSRICHSNVKLAILEPCTPRRHGTNSGGHRGIPGNAAPHTSKAKSSMSTLRKCMKIRVLSTFR